MRQGAVLVGCGRQERVQAPEGSVCGGQGRWPGPEQDAGHHRGHRGPGIVQNEMIKGRGKDGARRAFFFRRQSLFADAFSMSIIFHRYHLLFPQRIETILQNPAHAFVFIKNIGFTIVHA